MLRRTFKILTVAFALSFNSYILAQEAPKPPSKSVSPKAAPKVSPASPAPSAMPAPKIKDKDYEQAPEIKTGPVTMKIARGTRIAVSSKSIRVTIQGVDGDTLQA